MNNNFNNVTFNIPQLSSIPTVFSSWLTQTLGLGTQEEVSPVANSALATLELDLKNWIYNEGGNHLNRGTAAHKIRQAFLLESKYLELNNLELTTLPNSIELCVRVQRIALSSNQLSNFPAPIQKLVNLEDLCLCFNKIQSLPAEINSLKNLKRIVLDNNQLQSLPESIGSLTHLEELHLDHNKLESLPENIGLLVNLQKLSLSHNLLQSLPESIKKLVALNSLSLEKNQLFRLPEGIGSLMSLDELNLSNNNLVSLPETFSSLANLRELHLSNNLFPHFPKVICHLVNLVELYIGHNQIQFVPEELGYLVNLSTLSLHNNKLLCLPESIGGCVKLFALSISSNQNLTSLPMTLSNCIQLYYIFHDESAISSSQASGILEHTKATRMKRIERLTQKIQLWKIYAQVDYDFNFLYNEHTFNVIQRGFIAEWLNRLEHCQDFRHKRMELAQLVCNILSIMNPSHSNYSKDFNDAIFAKIEGNLECCDDRASMLLNMIYTDFVMYTIHPNTSDKARLKELVGLAKTITLRESIAKIIDEYQKVNPDYVFLESVEIYLFYESRLKGVLGLVTAINNMSYMNLGHAPNLINENALIQTVEDNYQKALVEISAVDLVLEKNTSYVSAKRVLEAEMDDEMERMEPKNGEPEQCYIDSVNALVVKKNTAIANLKKEFILKILEN